MIPPNYNVNKINLFFYSILFVLSKVLLYLTYKLLIKNQISYVIRSRKLQRLRN